MIQMEVQLSDAQAQALKALAEAQNKSVAELIQQSVDILLSTTDMTNREERKRRAIAAAGRFRSGLPDLSTGHDRYLTETYGR